MMKYLKLLIYISPKFKNIKLIFKYLDRLLENINIELVLEDEKTEILLKDFIRINDIPVKKIKMAEESYQKRAKKIQILELCRYSDKALIFCDEEETIESFAIYDLIIKIMQYYERQFLVIR